MKTSNKFKVKGYRRTTNVRLSVDFDPKLHARFRKITGRLKISQAELLRQMVMHCLPDLEDTCHEK